MEILRFKSFTWWVLKWVWGSSCHNYHHHHLASKLNTPRLSSLSRTMFAHPLLASGFLGDGCMIPSTLTVIPASESARRARCSASLPTPITIETPSAVTTWQRALSQQDKSASRSAAGSSGGVRFLPDSLIKMRGHKLCTKQWRKKLWVSPQSPWKKPQKRAPLTSLWVQSRPVIRRFGCSSAGRPTVPVIFNQLRTAFTSPNGTLLWKKSLSLSLICLLQQLLRIFSKWVSQKFANHSFHQSTKVIAIVAFLKWEIMMKSHANSVRILQ